MFICHRMLTLFMSSDFPRRRSLRLKDYDYSQNGAYFITICTQDRQYLLGEIINGEIILTDFGSLVEQKIKEMSQHYDVEIDTYCVMPNHIHMIMLIVGAGPCACPINKSNCSILIGSTRGFSIGSTRGSTPTVGEYVKRLKTITTKRNRIWQRNYYEHIIRDEDDLNRIREYVVNNPVNWIDDKLSY